jgi:hypothetical protein
MAAVTAAGSTAPSILTRTPPESTISIRPGAGFAATTGPVINEGTPFLAPVIDHGQRQTRGGQGYEHGDGITLQTGTDHVPPQVPAQAEHPEYPGRDVRGRWLKGTCGYPQDLLSD